MSSKEIINLAKSAANFIIDSDPSEGFTEEMQKMDSVLRRMSNTCYDLECTYQSEGKDSNMVFLS